jgi:hypothetical protein
MKKIMSLFLGMILTTQFALATGNDGLKKAMDEFHYAMTVDWDQQDQSFAQEQEHKFQTTIEKLIEDGLTVDQLKKAFNDNTHTSIDQIIGEINERNITDSLAVKNYIQQNLELNYSRGASWNLDDVGGVLAAVVIFAVLGAAVFTFATCGKNGRPQC